MMMSVECILPDYMDDNLDFYFIHFLKDLRFCVIIVVFYSVTCIYIVVCTDNTKTKLFTFTPYD